MADDALNTPMSLTPSEYLINRELSWVEFNRRVLDEARDPSHPLLERAKFLAIFATNLDEFYMIRMSGIKEQLAAGITDRVHEGLSPAEVVDLVNERLESMIAEHVALWKNEIKPALHKEGICVLDAHELNDAQRAFVQKYFQRTVFPVLTPLAFDPGRPFPHLSNLSLSLAVQIEDVEGKKRFARVKVPPSLPRLLALDECQDDAATCKHCFIWLDHVIALNIQALFPGTKIVGVYPFRVTRDADIEISEDEASDLRASIERGIKERGFLDVVRLEVDAAMPGKIRDILATNLELTDSDIWRIDGPLDLSKLWELYRIAAPGLKDLPFSPRIARNLNDGKSIFSKIKKNDILLHHPYDAFTPVVDFIKAAARDPDVLAIKQTLYRVGANSPIVEALIEAAQNGKQVAALVELKARFDEENNLEWARRLEAVGAHVVFGFSGIKVHSKIALVVRREGEKIRRYVHLSTGNYNAPTARVYTDIGLFTSNDRIGEDATELFNFLTGYSRQTDYRELLIAPVNLRSKLSAMIDAEIAHHVANGNGALMFKMNALVDPAMIAQLYRASQAGVQVDLIVRGMCTLRPGLPGYSENIRVRSIVGRFLEHSRVYWFNNNGAPLTYLGSADLMERNLDRRVEVVFPIHDDSLARRIKVEVLDLALSDNVKARVMQSDGRYARASAGEAPCNSQMKLLGVGTE
jgi:polyphosphate kinase